VPREQVDVQLLLSRVVLIVEVIETYYLMANGQQLLRQV
jgi:hypothetical protein